MTRDVIFSALVLVCVCTLLAVGFGAGYGVARQTQQAQQRGVRAENVGDTVAYCGTRSTPAPIEEHGMTLKPHGGTLMIFWMPPDGLVCKGHVEFSTFEHSVTK